jgi:triosephosphate isomerase
MRHPLVAGNWKMNGDSEAVATLVTGLLGIRCKAEIAVFPPYVYIPSVVMALKDSTIAVGGQNASEYETGAYTGEVSPLMLSDTGCQYALVGHSERRSLYGETDRQIAAKFAAVKAAGLVPVLCVGETLDQRNRGETLGVIAAQVDAVIEHVGMNAVCEAVIAYEPVWAIGTGQTASAEQAQEVHRAIRQQLGGSGEKTRILYGGSVKSANAAELFGQPDIDGALVGGASLDADEFAEICRLA